MNAMVVYTEKMYSEKMFLSLVWILWICHYLSIAFCCFDFAYLWSVHVHKRTHEKLRRRVKKINHKLKELERNRLKKIHRKLKDLETKYKMQYEHFTQLIDHVRTDLMDYVRKEMELRQMGADAPTYADHVTPSA